MPPKPGIQFRPAPWIKAREDLAEMPDGEQTIYGVV